MTNNTGINIGDRGIWVDYDKGESRGVVTLHLLPQVILFGPSPYTGIECWLLRAINLQDGHEYDYVLNSIRKAELIPVEPKDG